MTAHYTFWHYLNRRVTIDGRCVRLSPLQNELFFVLYVNAGNEVSFLTIVDALYGHCEDGGPLWVEHSLRIMGYRLRRKTGLGIRGTYKRGMVLVDPAAEQRRAA